ncbi:MAG: DinB family protein [Cytophagales bacterium]|nr:DinB family protein [Cytophagales bacterium]
MNSDLQKLLDRLEIQRETVLRGLDKLTTEQLNHAPAPGKWSIAEILSHILTAERISMQYMQKKIQGIATAKDSGLMEEVKITLLWLSQRLPGLKFKAPRQVVEHTASYKDRESIRAAWNEVRRDLRLLMEQIPNSHAKRLIYKHPRTGYLNAKHALIFFHEHMHHHLPQIRKIMKSL